MTTRLLSPPNSAFLGGGFLAPESPPLSSENKSELFAAGISNVPRQETPTICVRFNFVLSFFFSP